MSASDPITLGKDWNFFERVTITNTEFPDSCDILININYLNNLRLDNEGTEVVEYSFNGNTVHGELDPNGATASLLFVDRRENKIWFRVDSGSVDVRVEAW